MNLALLSAKRLHFFVVGFVVVFIACALFFRVVLGPFILALVIAYILDPLMDMLERKKVRRSLSALGMLSVAGIILVISLWFLLPVLFEQLVALAAQLPKFGHYVETNWLPYVNKFLRKFLGELFSDIRMQQLRDYFSLLLIPSSESFANGLEKSTRLVFHAIITVLLTPLFLFFLLRDLKRYTRTLFSMIPADLRGHVVSFLQELNETLRSVLRGQILVIGLLSLLYSTAFMLVGMPLGLAVGVMTGFFRLVPYMDIFIGGTLSFFVLVTNAAPPSVMLGVMISFLVIQIFDGLFLTPKIMGQFSGIHPFVIILSVLCFGDWFGFFGVLLAIPLAAVGRVALKALLRIYRESGFFRSGDLPPP